MHSDYFEVKSRPFVKMEDQQNRPHRKTKEKKKKKHEAGALTVCFRTKMC